jgi:hypothetical protein
MMVSIVCFAYVIDPFLYLFLVIKVFVNSCNVFVTFNLIYSKSNNWMFSCC